MCCVYIHLNSLTYNRAHIFNLTFVFISLMFVFANKKEEVPILFVCLTLVLRNKILWYTDQNSFFRKVKFFIKLSNSAMAPLRQALQMNKNYVYFTIIGRIITLSSWYFILPSARLYPLFFIFCFFSRSLIAITFLLFALF